MRISFILLFLLPAFLSQAQTVRQKDQYGEKLYYYDGNTIREKDQYGEKLFWFDYVPDRWVIVCVIKI